MESRVYEAAVAVVVQSAWSVTVVVRGRAGRWVVRVLGCVTGCEVGIYMLAVARPCGNRCRALHSAFSLVLFLCQG